MKWERVMQKYGWPDASIGHEPFHPLALQAGQARAAGDPTAHVSMVVGTSTEYGAVKVSATVTISCIQEDAVISLAGEATFMKALELVNDGALFLGIPPLRPAE